MEMIPQNAGHKYIAHRTHGCRVCERASVARTLGGGERNRSQGVKSAVSIQGAQGESFYFSP